jgi:putative holliday junction resolvase
MKYLGIDYGTKRIGIAISDDAGEFAFPKGIIKADSAVQDIVRMCDEEQVKGIVIGESIASNELENEVQSAVRQFGKRLTDAVGYPVSFEREDFSSVEAHRYQTGAGRRDDSAAAIILQRFLDKRKK